jgi:hypothetical protein
MFVECNGAMKQLFIVIISTANILLFYILNFIKMQKLSKLLILKENVVLLNERDMKMVTGGTVRCCCGMGSDITCYDLTVDVEPDWVIENCPGGIGGCFIP